MTNAAEEIKQRRADGNFPIGLTVMQELPWRIKAHFEAGLKRYDRSLLSAVLKKELRSSDISVTFQDSGSTMVVEGRFFDLGRGFTRDLHVVKRLVEPVARHNARFLVLGRLNAAHRQTGVSLVMTIDPDLTESQINQLALEGFVHVKDATNPRMVDQFEVHVGGHLDMSLSTEQRYKPFLDKAEAQVESVLGYRLVTDAVTMGCLTL